MFKHALFAGLFLLIITPAQTIFARPLAFGVVANDVQSAIQRWEPFIALLEKELPAKFTPVSIEVVSSRAGLLWELWDERIDFFHAEPVAALSLGAEADAIPIFASQQTDRACILVRRSSNARNLDDLTGKNIAFVSPSSSMGYAIPRLIMEEAGLELFEHQRHGERIQAGLSKVGYYFTLDQMSANILLLRGQVDASATTNRLAEQIKKNRPGEFRQLACSAPLPTGLAMVRRGFPERGQLETAITKMYAATPKKMFRLINQPLENKLQTFQKARELIEREIE